MIACSLLFLTFISVSHSSPPVCEKLTEPLDLSTLGPFEGQWALIAGSLSHRPSLEALTERDSITVYVSNSSGAVSYRQVNRFSDRCQHLLYNMSVDGRSFSFEVENRFQLAGAFLRTACPDCLVMRWEVKSSRRDSVDLYLLSRRRMVEQAEIQEFRAQVRCLQLPPPYLMNPFQELCPEQPESQSATPTP